MLRALDELGILKFHRQEPGRDGEYKLEVGGVPRSIEPGLLDSYIAGLLDGVRIPKRSLQPRAEEILVSLTGDDTSSTGDNERMEKTG